MSKAGYNFNSICLCIKSATHWAHTHPKFILFFIFSFILILSSFYITYHVYSIHVNFFFCQINLHTDWHKKNAHITYVEWKRRNIQQWTGSVWIKLADETKKNAEHSIERNEKFIIYASNETTKSSLHGDTIGSVDCCCRSTNKDENNIILNKLALSLCIFATISILNLFQFY